ncbi:MAG: sigma-70 family RNA polymerase sigma factor [Phycisphaerae bacterium]|nr:sigma-70 family RNA polymerase sigma factor [Phycisphaerae bacterium]
MVAPTPNSDAVEKYKQDEDVQLMLRFCDGDRAAFDKLVERNLSNVCGLVYRFLGNQSQVDDIAQEAFLRVLKNAHRYKPEAKFSTWLYRIVANLCFNVIRSRKTAKQISIHSAGSEDSKFDLPDETQQNPDAGLVGDERSKRVSEAVAKLPENQRLAIILNKYEDKSYAEIAEILDTTTMAVKSLLSRARVTLREQLEGYFKND